MGSGEKGPVIKRMERRNWWILGALLAGSALLCPTRFVVGVATGGILSVLGFHALEGVVFRILRLPAYKAKVRIVLYHYARLGILFATLAVLLAVQAVDPIGLVLGLSVVVFSLLLTMVLDLRKIQLEV
jgi:hypothetical protein